MKNVDIMLGNEVAKVQVKETVSRFERGESAKITAQMTAGTDEEFRPWLRDYLRSVALLGLYTDLKFPEDWKDEDVDDFFASEEWEKLMMRFPAKEVGDFMNWCDEIEEAEKALRYNSGTVLVEAVGKQLAQLKEELDKKEKESV